MNSSQKYCTMVEDGTDILKRKITLGYDLPIQLWWRSYGNSMKDVKTLATALENSNMKFSCTNGEFRDDVDALADVVVNPQHEAQEAQHEELSQNIHQEANEEEYGRQGLHLVLGLANPVVSRPNRWMSPPPDFFALTTDASVVLRRGFVGLGGVIRDTKGCGLVGVIIMCGR
uniref:RNase H type-1 domain-containing protein n=1 Tax=Cannabis sativa TaxID=3483 RepID=A0A803Q2I3_CANSA